MDRRKFFAGVGGLALGGLGLLTWNRSRARAAAVSGMLDDALPPFEEKALEEVKSLPAEAGEEIKRYFHGKCLNVDGFVTRVRSPEFKGLLARCRSAEEREACFLHAFCDRIAPEAEINGRVEAIAARLGAGLDHRWSAYCEAIAGRWGARLPRAGQPLIPGDLAKRFSVSIRAAIRTATQQADTLAGQAPALADTVLEVGKAAVLLVPLVRSLPPNAVLPVVVPVFIALTAKPVWAYVLGLVDDGRDAARLAIADKLAGLGKRIGEEFAVSVRLRLEDLHGWQERAVRAGAARLAEERIGLL